MIRLERFAFIACVACGQGASASGDGGLAPPIVPDAGDASNVVPLGVIGFSQDSSQPGLSFNATFHASAAQAASCVTTAYDSHCSLLDCTATLPPPPTLSAGPMTLSGGPFVPSVVAKTDTTGDYYFGVSAPMSPGAVLSVSAAGYEVPAFDAQVIVPTLITLTSPQVPYVISTKQDLTLAWSGGESGASVAVELISAQGLHSVTATCGFDAATGAGEMPAALIAALNDAHPMLLLAQTRETTFTAGTFPLRLLAMQSSQAGTTVE